MKPNAIILVFFLTITLFPQTPQDLIKVSVSEKERSEFQIHSLISTLEKSFNEDKDLISYKIIESNEKENEDAIEGLYDFRDVDYLKIRLNKFDLTTTTSCDVFVILNKYQKGVLNEFETRLNFKKENGRWCLVRTSLIGSMVKKIQSAKDQKREFSSPSITSVSTIIENNRTLLPMKFVSSPDIWEINKDLLMDNFSGKQFFSESAEIDGNMLVYGSNINERVILLVDPVWARIIYVNTNTQEIKSYGDNTGDFRFENPVSIAVGENGDFYVADRGHKEIIKLIYNSGSNTINYSGILTIPGLGIPSDVDYRRSFSGLTPKSLWIVDVENQKLVQVDLNGTILNTATQYKFNGSYFDFVFVERIVTGRYFEEVCFVDNGAKKVVRGVMSNSYINANSVVEFSEESYLTDVGMSPRWEYIVTDMGLNKIHKLNSLGDVTLQMEMEFPKFTIV